MTFFGRYSNSFGWFDEQGWHMANAGQQLKSSQRGKTKQN